MRLIDADVLKKCKVYSYGRREYVVPVYFIDNAKTVIPEDFINSYEEGYEKAKKDFERPTGKWHARRNKYYSGGGYYFCNKCNQRFSFGAYFELNRENFCPHCGANMNNKEDGNGK